MKTYVLYHANCWDGFCAAWIARGCLDREAEFIPVQYGQLEPKIESGSILFMLDFSYPREQMRNLLSQMHRVIVLDHHKTSEAVLHGLTDEFVQRPDLIQNIPGSELPVIHFDMDKSGARLTWEHFYGNSGMSTPGLVDYTEDRDLWRWALPGSKAVNACLRSYPLDFKLWDTWGQLSPIDIAEVFFEQGKAILRRERQIIEDHLIKAREITMDGHKILAVNATVLFSDIAGQLANDRPFGACYFDRADGKRQWSLRSREGGIDVSEVARRHGGGGHRNAAGFEQCMDHEPINTGKVVQ